MSIIDVIKYEGNNDIFIWKHPAEDFNTLSQLIVHESQEAVLFLNGRALDLFGPGRYTLHTQNIPLLSKLINLPMGGESPFHCEVYFVNKTEKMAIKWGMGNVNYLDPTHNDYAFQIGASGEMSVKVDNSKQLITKLVGTEEIFTQETLTNYFKTPIQMYIKTMLPQILREKGFSIFEVEKELADVSALLKTKVSEEMSDYGIKLEKFWINTIVKPEEDQFYITLNRQRGAKVTTVNQGEIDKIKAQYGSEVEVIEYAGKVRIKEMDIDIQKHAQDKLGFTWQQGRGFDVMEKIAQNEGSGSDLRNAALNVGMGFGTAGVFSSAITDIANNTMMSNLMEPNGSTSTSLNEDGNIPGMVNLKEEIDAESNMEDNEHSEGDSLERKIKYLAMMHEKGILSDEEFSDEKRHLLNSIRKL